MAKLFFTELPSKEELQKEASVLYPNMDSSTLYSHILLRKVSTDLETNLEAFFSDYNLSSGRFALLLLLGRAPQGLMPTEMAQKVGVTQATISGLINSLEKAELVKRTTHEKDGRSYVIRLTDKGFSLCQKIVPLYHERVNHFWSEFNSSEKEQISGVFERMIRVIGKIGQG